MNRFRLGLPLLLALVVAWPVVTPAQGHAEFLGDLEARIGRSAGAGRTRRPRRRRRRHRRSVRRDDARASAGDDGDHANGDDDHGADRIGDDRLHARRQDDGAAAWRRHGVQEPRALGRRVAAPALQTGDELGPRRADAQRHDADASSAISSQAASRRRGRSPTTRRRRSRVRRPPALRWCRVRSRFQTNRTGFRRPPRLD